MDEIDIKSEFISEIREHLVSAEADLLALESRAPAIDINVVNKLFRAIHTIKGAGGFLNMKKLTNLAHSMENLVALLRKNEIFFDPEVGDALLKGLDGLVKISDSDNPESVDITASLALLEAVKANVLIDKQDAHKADEAATINPAEVIIAGNDDKVMPESSVTTQFQKILGQHDDSSVKSPENPLSTVAFKAGEASGDSTIRIPLGLVDKLMNLATELVLVRNQCIQAVEAKDLKRLSGVSQRLNIVTSDLQTTIMCTRMQPIGNVLNKFGRIVRDLAKKLRKEVNFQIIGADVELDKNILECISDPLTHIIRNSLDHGIETPDIRKAAGKSRVGSLVLSAFHKAGQVIIQIKDDGKGMDPEKIRAKALEKGMFKKEHAKTMGLREIYGLIFEPGFSTADEISDLSGRGVGMDVVKTSFNRLGGIIDVFSQVGKGTTITITLPLTLAIVPALVVGIEDYFFAVPQINIVEVVWLHGSDVFTRIERIHGQEVYWLRGKLLPVIRLADILEISSSYVDPATGDRNFDRRDLSGRSGDVTTGKSKSTGRLPKAAKVARETTDSPEIRQSIANSLYIIILQVGKEEFGLIIDRIVDTEEIVIKPLHSQLESCRVFAGSTVMGDGSIAMVLDIGAVAELGSLKYVSSDQAERKVRSSSFGDKQAVLLFDIGGEDHFAVPLSIVSRVEEMLPNRIKRAKGKTYLEMRGETIPLLNIDRAIPDFKASYGDTRFVIIPKSKRPFGIIAARIRDNVEVNPRLDTKSVKGQGIVGTMLLDGELVLFLDILQIAEMAEPGLLTSKVVENPARILLVEDSNFYSILLRSSLRNEGYIVDAAENGLEGKKMLMNAPYDLVISDIEMPVMNGLELAKWIRSASNCKSVPLLSVSAMDPDEAEVISKEAGFDRFISKSKPAELSEAVAAILGNRVNNSRERAQ